MFLPPNERTIVPPITGWEDRAYYVVDMSMSRTIKITGRLALT